MIIMPLSMTLSNIKTRIEANSIDDSLDFQRNYVWPKQKQRDLITTYQARKGFGIISFCRVNDLAPWGILDGKQRVTTLILFMNGEFKDNDGNTFAQWTEGDRVRLQQLHIHMLGYTLQEDEDESDLVEQFVLLNNGGQKLNQSELIYASNAPAVQKATEFFHSFLGADGINDADEQLRNEWCGIFRSPGHFAKEPLSKVLRRVCGEHGLDTNGNKPDLIGRIGENPEALQALETLRSELNDGRLPVSKQARKNQYGVTVPMIVSACSNDLNAITGSFNKLKRYGLSHALSGAGLERVRTCLKWWMNWVRMQREIEMPEKYKINHPKLGIPNIQKIASSWSIILQAMEPELEEENEFHTQCVHLFDEGNFKPLLVFYNKLATDTGANHQSGIALRWRFDSRCGESRGSMKQLITNKVKFIYEHCQA